MYTVSEIFFISSMRRCSRLVHNLKMSTEWGYIPFVPFLGSRSLLVFSFTSRPFYPRFPWNSKLHDLSILFACFGQRENPCWESKGNLFCFTTCIRFTIKTVLCRLQPVAHSSRRAACKCILFNITLCVRLLNCLRMRKNWSYRSQAICSLRTKAAGTHSCCCFVRFAVCYF